MGLQSRAEEEVRGVNWAEAGSVREGDGWEARETWKSGARGRRR